MPGCWSAGASRPGSPPVTVVQALPKSERSELAIELATEAGADAFLAWQAARCVANWEGARLDKGLRRWRAVARSAARQSRRAHIPPVDGVLSTAALTQRVRDEVAAGAVVLALHESATDRLADVAVAQADSLMLVVGPEGGIAPDEIAALTDAGAVAVRLGPTGAADVDGGRGGVGRAGRAYLPMGSALGNSVKSEVGSDAG